MPRADLTDVPFVTVDPPGSTDLDQALHLSRTPAAALERACLDAVEAAVLVSRVGKVFDAVVIDVGRDGDSAVRPRLTAGHGHRNACAVRWVRCAGGRAGQAAASGSVPAEESPDSTGQGGG